MDVHKKTALRLIIIFGFVSLFGDVIYEGARGVNGPYLATLGASAVTVGLVAGIGEFLGYAIRLFSGYLSDKTKAYWFFTFLGYAVLAAIPLLGYVRFWQAAVFLIIIERIGKGMRNPARDTILSHATHQVGTGFGFGLHEAMDQIGAVTGPLIFAGVFFFSGAGKKGLADYQHGYRLLWLPFILLMFCLVLARRRVPEPSRLESSIKKSSGGNKLPRVFWLYTAFSFVATLGFANFALIGFHFKAQGVLTDTQIPLFYALAMAVDAVAALSIGKIYDKFKYKLGYGTGGLTTLIVIPALTILIPVLVFSNNHTMAVAGVIIWGVVMGCHETIMRSAIADITPLAKRGTGYGIMNITYGCAIMLGSFLMGLFYQSALGFVIIGAVAAEILSLPLFFMMKKEAALATV